MLDFDLAEMYGIETRVLKQSVKRNIKRFEGEDFMFELTKEELLRSQIVILNAGRGKKLPFFKSVFSLKALRTLKSLRKTPTMEIAEKYIHCQITAP